MSIGKNLKIIRTKKKISQQEIADYLGVDRKTYVAWEAGVEIKSSFVPKLAAFLDVGINDLFQEKRNYIIDSHSNIEKKDLSINNSVVLLLADKETIIQLFEVIKEQLTNKSKS